MKRHRYKIVTRTGKKIDSFPTKKEAQLRIADIYKWQRKIGARKPEEKMKLKIVKIYK